MDGFTRKTEGTVGTDPQKDSIYVAATGTKCDKRGHVSKR